MKQSFPASLVLIAALCRCAEASSVLWGVFGTGSGIQEGNVNRLDVNCLMAVPGTDYMVYPNIELIAVPDDMKWDVSISSTDCIVLAYGDNWVLSEYGRPADSSTTRNQDEYFLQGWMDSNLEVRTGSITADYESTFTFYLAFATGIEYNGLDVWEQDPFGTVHYGWAEIEYSRGALSVVDSAIALEPNTGIYVGTGTTVPVQLPVPEPGAGCLAAVGAALLAPAAARRRRTA